ncbi:twin-arginine translocation signal domain-containing protein [Streptomyces sp. MB09-01]|uniref:twin-arginine translocation signal domain-containing protein n=1 Tax=Streptomyces sp. MB09-01 TaxID=3028666 RepID=UPI003A5BBF34
MERTERDQLDLLPQALPAQLGRPDGPFGGNPASFAHPPGASRQNQRSVGVELSRRDLMKGAAAGGLLLGFPGLTV